MTNAMVLSCEKSKEAVVIDPAPGSKEAILSCIEERNLHPVAIWLTHSHFDHIGDLAAVKEALSVPVYIHPLDRKNVEAPGSDGLPYSVGAHQSGWGIGIHGLLRRVHSGGD